MGPECAVCLCMCVSVCVIKSEYKQKKGGWVSFCQGQGLYRRELLEKRGWLFSGDTGEEGSGGWPIFTKKQLKFQIFNNEKSL